MFSLIRQWEASEKDRATFCREFGLTVATFSYWRTKYLRALKYTTSGGFIELKPRTVMPIEIIYPNGVIIRLSQLSTTSELKALVQLI
jgi:hypothetical protein